MTPPRPAPAVTAMWVWDNPVDPAADPRGRAYVPAATDRLVAFAGAAGLRDVYLAVPAPADGHRGPGDSSAPVDRWLRDTAAALRRAGVTVTAAVDVAEATAGWAARTTALARWDRLQVAVVRWDPAEPAEDAAGSTAPAVLAALDDARSAGTAVPLDACVPWWFATSAGDDGRSLLESVAARVDRVVLAAPAAQAQGPDGVLGLAAAGVGALVAAGRRFTVAVRTDAPAGPDDARRTFHSEGPVALLRECAVVTQALADVPGFDGVAVDSHRAWRRLLGV